MSEIDWEGIEREYRSGQGTLAEIGRAFGISKGRICQVAKKRRWDRDLSARIKAKAQTALNNALLDDSLNAKRIASDTERVEAGAAAITSLVLGHRKDAKALQDKANQYTAELDAAGDDLAKKVSTFKMLVDVKKTLNGMQYEAFGMNSDGKNDTGDAVPLEERLAKYREAAAIEAAPNVVRLSKAA